MPQRARISAGYQMIKAPTIGLQFTMDVTTFLIDVRDYHNQKLNKTAWYYGTGLSICRMIEMRFGRRLNYLDDGYNNALGIATKMKGFRAGIAVGGNVDFILTVSYEI